MLNAHLKSYI